MTNELYDKYTVNEFVKQCRCGTFIDSDGSGYYGNDESESEVRAIPSKMRLGDIDRSFTHVYWYNK